MTHFHFFIDSNLLPETVVTLEGPEFHHARDVLRMKSGENIIVINGKGTKATGHIDSMERHKALIHIDSVETHELPKQSLWLGLALLRPSHLDIAIEKCTEIGVDHFVLFPAEKSEKKELYPSILRRLEAIIIAATKQSGRLFRPTLIFANSLDEALSLLPSPHIWTDLTPDATLLPPLQSPSASVLVGPESGWSANERETLLKTSPPITLHHNVLRAETAAIIAAYTVYQSLEK